MADRSAAGGMADGTSFFGDHLGDIQRHTGMDIFLGDIMGYRGADVWIGDALPGYVAGQLGVIGFYLGIRSAGAFYLLQFQTYTR